MLRRGMKGLVTLFALEFAYSYGLYIQKARRLTEEERASYSEWFRDYGLVGLGEEIALDELPWNDDLIATIRSRPADGEFPGCSNSAWIITEKEKEELIARNESNRRVAAQRKKVEEMTCCQRVIAQCEMQRTLYTAEEAKRKRKEYNDRVNEGGEGFVPHFWTVDEYESAKARLQELQAQNGGFECF